MISPTPGTRPYKGSCHCGAIKYIIFLTLPHLPTNSGPSQTFHKCNCTICHKLALLHVRVASPADDFILLSPSDPLQGVALGHYHTTSKPHIHWLFCKTCGGRCFTFVGEGEHDEVDLGALGVAGEHAGRTTKVWRVKKVNQDSDAPRDLSINGHSIDASQEGLDLREWVDKGWIKYVECLSVEGEGVPKFGDKPFLGGTY